MKPGNQQLKSRRQSDQLAQERLARLNSVDQWTEEPARAQAAALAQPPGEPAVETAEEPPVAAKTPVTVKRGSAGGSTQAAPIQQNAEANEHMLVTTFRIPASLHTELKFVAGSIPGESMTSILVRVLSAEVEVLRKRIGQRNGG